MTAAPHSPLVGKVGKAILDTMFWEFGVLKINPDKAAQAALDACHAEEMLRLLKRFKELRGASFVNSEQRTRCWNDLDAQATALLAKLDGRSSPPTGLGYCPICGAAGRSREKRPFGNDTCEAGHVYASSSALLAKLDGEP